MAVAYDTSGGGSGSSSSTTYTYTHTLGAISNGAVLAGFAVDAATDTMTLTVTFGGTPMTSLGKVHCNNQTAGYVQVFGLATGAATGAQTVTVTASAAPADLNGGSLSFSGVNQVTPFAAAVTNFGNGAAPSAVTAGSTSGGMVAGFAANGSPITSATSPATSRFIDNFAAVDAGGHSAAATSPSTGSNVTMAWTVTSDWWAAIAVELISSNSALAGLATGTGTGRHAVVGAPLTISSGGTYTGTFGSGDPAVAAVDITTTSPVTLSGMTINHAGVAVQTVSGSSLTMINCSFTAVAAPDTTDQYDLLFQGGGSADIRHCRFTGGHGIVLNALGATFTHLVISYNDFIDISAGSRNNVFVGAVHGYGVTAPNGALVSWNRVTNHYGNSQTEDVFSFTNSNGAAGSEIVFEHNLVNGSYPYPGTTADASNGATFSGSGFDNGDGGGTSSYMISRYNTAVRTTNDGLMIVAGSNMSIQGCTAIATGYALDSSGGTTHLLSATGGNGVSDWSSGTNTSVTGCTAGWLRWTGTVWQRADFYFPSGTESGNTSLVHDPADADVNNAIAAFESSAVSASVVIGPAPLPSQASGAGAAQSPAVAVTANAGLASGTGAAQAVSAAVAVTAGLASGTGTAQAAAAVAGASAGAASGTAAAVTATLAAAARVSAAQALAAALNAAAPFTVGTLTAADGLVATLGTSSGTGTAGGPS